MDHRQTTSAVVHQWSLLNTLTPRRERICALSVVAPIRILNLTSKIIEAQQEWPQLCQIRIAEGSYSDTPQVQEPVKDRVPSWKIGMDRPIPRTPRLECLSIVGLTPMVYDTFRCLKELHVKESAYFALASDHPGGSSRLSSSYFGDIQNLSIVSSPLPLLVLFRPANTAIASLTLSHLRPVDNPPGVLACFLTALRMPALEHLTIHHLHGHLHDEFVDWLAGANDPWPSLRTVDFESLVLDAQALRAFKSAKRLRIVDGDVRCILEILEGDPGLCPNISVIDAGDDLGMLRIQGRN